MRDKMKEVVRIVALRIYRVCQHVWNMIRYVFYKYVFLVSKIVFESFFANCSKAVLDHSERPPSQIFEF